ncbi:unnamed protein product, partial [Mesorhabditis belari]|uniref:Uncharacterized protein n=1 Tax=Mesorhabditis belari TaxID=2138241 RepID=A0AAF3ED03_9BILA
MFVLSVQLVVQEANLKNGNKIVVKHSLLGYWKAYLAQVGKLKDLSDKFFVAHVEFRRVCDEMVDRTGFWLLHAEKLWFKKAVETYFEAHFSGSKVTCNTPKEATAGGKLAFLVDVSVGANNQMPASYYAKVMADHRWSWLNLMDQPSLAPKSSDLREIFVYHLLSLIGVGSEKVLVIPDVPRSGYVYLATKIIDGFWTDNGKSVAMMRGAKDEKEPTYDDESKKAKDEQIKILTWLLDLGDLGLRRKSNSGRSGARIEDRRFLEWVKPTQSVFDKHFAKWNLMDNIEKAQKLVMDDEAIKDNVNVDKETFDAYVKESKDKVGKFLKTRKRSADE